MSQEPTHPRKTSRANAPSRPSSGGFAGIPTWSGPAIVIASLITGMLLSLASSSLGVAYLVCFVVAGILVALLTEARGLFLTVVSLPLLFGVITPVSAWLIGQLGSSSAQNFSVTAIATSIYPLAQFFPVLISVTLGATAIAVLRLWLLNRKNQARAKAVRAARRRDAEAERRNRDTAVMARSQTTKIRPRRSDRTGERITVEELMSRDQRRPDRSVTDDLYSD